MALFTSQIIAQGSGSMGGTTFSHNRFGPYMRAKRTPVNPNTTYQQEQRNVFAVATAAWRALTDAQRAAWASYAAATPVTNRLGATVYLTGSQMHVATNSFAGRLGIAAISAAPVTPGRQAIGLIGVIITAAAGGTIAVDSIESTLNTTGTVAVFVGDPVSAGVRFYKGPYQLRGYDQPAAGAISITPVVGRNNAPFVVAQRIPVRVAGIDATGRLTTVWEGIVTVS